MLLELTDWTCSLDASADVYACPELPRSAQSVLGPIDDNALVTFQTHFECQELQEHAILTFEWVDAIADVYLNNSKILKARNAFLEYEYGLSEVIPALRPLSDAM